MDMEKRAALILRMGEVSKYKCGVIANRIPLILPQQYYDGAEDNASLLCNSIEELSNEAVLEGLSAIAERADVQAVYVALSNCDDDDWPFADKIVIVTTASNDEILSWLPRGFEPDEIYDRAELQEDAEKIEVRVGYREVWLWFD